MIYIYSKYLALLPDSKHSNSHFRPFPVDCKRERERTFPTLKMTHGYPKSLKLLQQIYFVVTGIIKMNNKQLIHCSNENINPILLRFYGCMLLLHEWIHAISESLMLVISQVFCFCFRTRSLGLAAIRSKHACNYTKFLWQFWNLILLLEFSDMDH